eukprot:CAMPEP_0175146698 /NCGR_PEP_ID=MMETSP0087-20121206/15526_1 /TAXON_ID=136419 /ORGANISM="Unknown Unknown, Strain D1" /LENGTH=79 /DNA_ID=CAMNT_0016431695 /DNA_START=9 /DNA_END=244 /DNA_ORIENTATION=-
MVKSWKQIIAESGAVLWLPYKGVSDDDCKEIGPALAANKTITTLLLGGTGIGDKGIIPLVDALKANKTLLRIDVRYNSA